jgi:hypothetical protein
MTPRVVSNSRRTVNFSFIAEDASKAPSLFIERVLDSRIPLVLELQ